MLIAHASSTCDVCLDTFSEGVSYHSIPCGHVFCLSCLIATNPSRCPLCRHEFSVHTMRKLHLTLPSSRDHFARMLEMRLVQTSPEMTLAESLSLFQEVQDWLDGQSEEEFLVLRAFAAVLCGFHEMKDKLSTTEHNFEQFKVEATEKEDELRRSLEEARNTSDLHINDYKSKYREAKAALSQLETEAELLQSQLDQLKEREKQNQSTLDATRNLYQTAKIELTTLRDECTDLRLQVAKHQESERKRIAEYRDYYNKIQVHIQSQVQAQVQAQTQSLLKAVEARAQSRRQSNPLPPPPKQVEVPFLKYMAKSTAARRASSTINELEEERRRSRNMTTSPSKASSSSTYQSASDDPISSVFVPTLAASYPSRRVNGNDGHSEVTTLVFNPPERIPQWEETAAEQSTAHSIRQTSQRQTEDALREPQRSRRASQGPGDVSEEEQSEPNTALTIVAPTSKLSVTLPSSKANAQPSYLTYDEYISYDDPPYVEKYPGWGGAGFVSPFMYNPLSAVQEPALRPSAKQSELLTPTQPPAPRRVSSPTVLLTSRSNERKDAQDALRRERSRAQPQSQPYGVEDASAGPYDHYNYYYDHRRHAQPPPPTVVRFRYPGEDASSLDSQEESAYDGQETFQNADYHYRYPNTRRIVVEAEEI